MKIEVGKMARSAIQAYRNQPLPYKINLDFFIDETSSTPYGMTISVSFGDKTFGKRMRTIIDEKRLYLSCEVKEENHGSFFNPNIQRRRVCTVKQMEQLAFLKMKVERVIGKHDLKQIPILSKMPVTRYFEDEFIRESFAKEIKHEMELFFQQEYHEYLRLVQIAESPSLTMQEGDEQIVGLVEAIQLLKDNPNLPKKVREPLETMIEQVRGQTREQASESDMEDIRQEIDAITQALKLTHKIVDKE